MTQPLREEYPTYDLKTADIVQLHSPMDPVTATPEAVKAAPDALLPPKNRAKPGPKKGSKRKPRMAKASSPAKSPENGGDSTPLPQPPSPALALNAAGTDGRRRYTVPTRVWFIGAIIASLAIGAGLALVIR